MEKIKLLDITEIEEKKEEVSHVSLDTMSIQELIDLDWKEYLKLANYNKDPYKMCEDCIAEQKRKYNGRTPIVCNGLKDYKTSLASQYDEDVLEELAKEFSEEELLEIQGAFSAPEWFKSNIKDPRTYSPRFHQDLVLKCSAKHKVIRMGRRCGKTFGIILDIIHRIETTDRPLNFLVAAPLLTMITEVERTIVGLVKATGRENFIIHKKASPTLEITFFNGSLLQGITLSNDGSSARGKKADLLWVDEMDFANRKSLEALQAIEMDNPHVEVVYTSTPIGQGNLYAAEQLENTKSFHFPSYVIPHFSDALYKSMRSSLSDVGFAQETLALFGLDESGVFQIHYIENGIDLHIPDIMNENTVLVDRSRFIIFIGVDWNHDLNGTRVVVTAYDKNSDRFFVVEKAKIAKQNLTQAIAVDLVVELNRKYHADHICCDEGFGIGQVTELRTRGREQYGKVPVNHPDIKLVDTMSVQFGSSLEIRDPTTQEVMKKNTKQYIVENTQKLLEEKRLAFNDVDDNELIMQMKNYSVISSGLRGNKYKAKDKKIGDHDLDAYMLCLYAFDYHYGEFIKPKLVEHGSLVAQQGIQYGIPKEAANQSLVGMLHRKGSKYHGGHKKPFKMRKRWN